MRESNAKFFLSHINLSNLVNLLTSTLFFHSLHIVVLGLPLLSPLVALLSHLVLKYQISAPVLWNNLPSHLCQVVHHVTPSPISNSPLPDLSTSLFLKKLKTHLFHFSFSPNLYSPMGYLRTDISGIDQACLFISHTFRYPSPSYHSRHLFMLFD